LLDAGHYTNNRTERDAASFLFSKIEITFSRQFSFGGLIVLFQLPRQTSRVYFWKKRLGKMPYFYKDMS